MAVDYDNFRAKPWGERLALFNEISAEERAELVRTQVTRWLQAHRDELTAGQIGILEEIISFLVPELYERPRNRELFRRFQELEKRTAALLSREQMCDALTMHWDQPGQ